MGGKSSAPDSPDYVGVAQEQGNQNRQTALFNTMLGRINTNNPYGSTSWDGQTFNTTLSPDQQANLNSQNYLSGMARGSIGSAFTNANQGPNWAGAPAMVTNVDSSIGDNARNAAVKAVYDQYSANLDPQFTRQQTDLETKLTNQGFDPNSDAYKEQMATFDRNKAAAYQQANNAAVQQGQQAQQQAFQQAYSNADLNNKARDSYLSQELQKYTTNWNTLNNLRSMLGVNMPSGAQGAAGNAQAPDLMGATQSGYNAALNQTNVSNANNASTWGTVGQLGGLAALGFAMF